ncbi:MAG: hypothetical protein HFE35_07960 [Clostridia bacterium]|nr:hypothetical protein [Clostridia bacterium]
MQDNKQNLQTDEKFELQKVDMIQKLIGQKFCNIFYQPTAMVLGDDIFVINFGNNIDYSLHVGTYLRFVLDNSILLTSCDIHFSPSYQSINLRNSNEKTLLDKNLSNIKKLLKGSYVSSVSVTLTADIIITFSNNIKLEITTDCLCDDYEYYRFMSLGQNKKSIIVYSSNGRICIRREEDID